MFRNKKFNLENKSDVYEAMFEALPQSLFLLDKYKNIIGVFNASPETLAGGSIDDVIGKNLMIFINDLDSPYHQACTMLNDTFEKVFYSGDPLKFQYKIFDCYFEATITKIIGDRILSQVQDITDIVVKQLEQEKRKRNELTMAMTAGGLFSWSFDVQSGVVTSQENNNVIGASILLNELLNLVQYDYRQKITDLFDRIINRGEEHGHVTVRVLNKSGLLQWSDVHAIPYEYAPDGSVSVVAGSQKDITTEYEYNSQLRRLIAQNELILNNSSSAFVYFTRDMNIEWENLSKIYNDPELTCLVHHGERLCDSKCIHQDKCCRSVILKSLRTSQRTTSKFRTSSNFIVEIIAQPLFDYSAGIDGIVVRIDDITQKEHILDQMSKAKELAEQSDKLKSAFLANMSHEIRTPLNSIIGFSQLISQVDNEEERKQYIDIVNSNSEILLNLINDILDLSKIEAGYINRNDSVFDLTELFSETVTIFTHKMKIGVELQYSKNISNFLVKLDRVRISQILTNFLTNAIKFTREGYIKIGYYIIGSSKVRIYVEDTGIGMKEDEISRVFNRFEKFNIFEQGTGLGTSIAKAIVDAYGGEIGVKSTLGKGSIFWVDLPTNLTESTNNSNFSDEDIENSTQLSVDNNSLARILIAEDNDSNFMLIKALLKGYTVVRAVNGVRAVEFALSQQFDIVIMNMQMPIMDGIEATRQIRLYNKKLPIVFIMANTFIEDNIVTENAGANDFITRPIKKQKLIDTISKYVVAPEKV